MTDEQPKPLPKRCVHCRKDILDKGFLGVNSLIYCSEGCLRQQLKHFHP